MISVFPADGCSRIQNLRGWEQQSTLSCCQCLAFLDLTRPSTPAPQHAAPNDPNFADGSLRRKMAFLNAGFVVRTQPPSNHSSNAKLSSPLYPNSTCSTSRQLENVLFAGGVGMVVVDLDTAAEAANLHSSAVPIFGLAQAQACVLFFFVVVCFAGS